MPIVAGTDSLNPATMAMSHAVLTCLFYSPNHYNAKLHLDDKMQFLPHINSNILVTKTNQLMQCKK
jgi:hypothetical protein